MPFCPNCGKKMKSRVCSRCGYSAAGDVTLYRTVSDVSGMRAGAKTADEQKKTGDGSGKRFSPKKLLIIAAALIVLIGILAAILGRDGEEENNETYIPTVTDEGTTAGTETTTAAEASTESSSAAETQASESTAAEKTTAAKTLKAASKPKYVELYKNVLRNYDNKSAQFSLAYIDNNDVPELLVAQGHYHGAQVSVYTEQNGVIYNVGDFGSWGEMGYAEREGLIISGYTGQGFDDINLYELKNGAVGLKWKAGTYFDMTAGFTDDPEENMTYSIWDTEVTKEEFEASYAENVPQNIKNSDCKYQLTEENIEKYIR